MKKSLLFLASLFMTVGMFAQWTQPIPTASTSFKYSTLAAEGAGDSTIYYLYNKDAKAFLNQGNAWGTQASIKSTGLKVMVSKYVAEDGAEWDGKTVLISDSVETKGAWYLLFIDSETQSYVDHGSQKNYFWQIEDCGNSIFRIYGADLNPDYNTEKCGNGTIPYFGMSYSVSETTTAITPVIDINEDPTAQVDWQFISEADYAAYLEKATVYDQAVALKAAIDKAQTEYPGKVSTSAAEAVYNNTSSTYEELTAALNALNDAIKKAEFGDATEDNPKDVTSWLINPTFDGDAHGWTNTFVSGTNATNVGYQSANYTNGDVTINQFIESWANSAYSKAISSRAIGVGELSQTIGGMPQGKYKFTVDCIANNQDGVTPVNGVQLFAKGGTLDVFQSLATGNGAPEHFELVFVNNGDSLTIGLRTTEDCNANWIAADNFTLTYYGPTAEDPEKILLDQIVEKALAAYPLETLGETLANKDVKDAYQSAIEDAQSASSDYTAKGEAVTAASTALSTSATAYAAYKSEVDYIDNYLSNWPYQKTSEAAESLSDYVMEGNAVAPCEEYPLGSAAYIYENLLPTDDEITAETQRIITALSNAIASSLSEGDDCTTMIADADFSDASGKGWTVGSLGKPGLWTGGLIPNFPVAEAWHTTFDIYQDVEVPNGIYAVSLNGFVRRDSGAEVEAEIYMNNFSSKFMDIQEGGIPTSDGVDGFNCYLTTVSSAGTECPVYSNPIFEGATRSSNNDAADTDTDGLYAPNGMEGASVAFSAGRYQAIAYGLVTDGKIRLGVRNTRSDDWCLWGNFKLTYMGQNVEALNTVIGIFTTQLTEYVENNSENMTAPALESAQAAIDKAEAATDADAMYDALINLNNETSAAKENVAAVTAFNTEVESINAVVEAYPDADISSYEALADRIADYQSLTTEGVNTLVADMQASEKAIKLSVISQQVAKASASAPIDLTELVLTNPSFETGTLDGWTNEGAINWQTQSNTAFAKTETYYAERWHVSGTLDLNQTVTLPAGIYVLTAEAYTSTEDAILYVNGNEVSIPVTDDATVATTYTIEFTLKETTDVKIGAKATLTTSTWNCVDNFTLSTKGNDPTAIKSVATTSSSIANASAIYSAAGTRVNGLQKGVNIVKMSDGTVKKVMVK